MSTSLPLILITGASGYLGSHIVQEALVAAYPVRITARSGKVELLREQYAGKVDVVAIDDVATGDFTDALKDVGAVIHSAAPLPGRASPAGMLAGAAEGGLNIVRQSVRAGIRRIVITSSFASANEDSSKVFSDYQYTDQGWNPATKEQVLDGSYDHLPGWIYAAVKTLAEKEIWKYAEDHPDVDITTINPPYLYGPILPGSKIAKGQLAAYSTPGMFYSSVLSGGKLKPI